MSYFEVKVRWNVHNRRVTNAEGDVLPNRATRRRLAAAVLGTTRDLSTRIARGAAKYLDGEAGRDCAKIRPKRVRLAHERALAIEFAQ